MVRTVRIGQERSEKSGVGRHDGRSIDAAHGRRQLWRILSSRLRARRRLGARGGLVLRAGDGLVLRAGDGLVRAGDGCAWRFGVRGGVWLDAVLEKTSVVLGALLAFPAIDKVLGDPLLLLVDVRLVGNQCVQTEGVQATAVVDVDNQLLLQTFESSVVLARRRSSRSRSSGRRNEVVLGKLVFGGVGRRRRAAADAVALR